MRASRAPHESWLRQHWPARDLMSPVELLKHWVPLRPFLLERLSSIPALDSLCWPHDKGWKGSSPGSPERVGTVADPLGRWWGVGEQAGLLPAVSRLAAFTAVWGVEMSGTALMQAAGGTGLPKEGRPRARSFAGASVHSDFQGRALAVREFGKLLKCSQAKRLC